MAASNLFFRACDHRHENACYPTRMSRQYSYIMALRSCVIVTLNHFFGACTHRNENAFHANLCPAHTLSTKLCGAQCCPHGTLFLKACTHNNHNTAHSETSLELLFCLATQSDALIERLFERLHVCTHKVCHQAAAFCPLSWVQSHERTIGVILKTLLCM